MHDRLTRQSNIWCHFSCTGNKSLKRKAVQFQNGLGLQHVCGWCCTTVEQEETFPLTLENQQPMSLLDSALPWVGIWHICQIPVRSPAPRLTLELPSSHHKTCPHLLLLPRQTSPPAKISQWGGPPLRRPEAGCSLCVPAWISCRKAQTCFTAQMQPGTKDLHQLSAISGFALLEAQYAWLIYLESMWVNYILPFDVYLRQTYFHI